MILPFSRLRASICPGSGQFHSVAPVAGIPKVAGGQTRSEWLRGQVFQAGPSPGSPLLPVPRTVGSPCLPGSQFPTLSCSPDCTQLPPARRAQELGSPVWDNMQTHVPSSSVLLRGQSLRGWGAGAGVVSLDVSGFHRVTVCLPLSLSLPFLARTAVQRHCCPPHALLRNLPSGGGVGEASETWVP